MKVVIFKPVLRGGACGSGATSIHGRWPDGPINPDSYSSWMIFDGFFDRIEKFSFWVKLGRSEVEVQPKFLDFLYKLQ